MAEATEAVKKSKTEYTAVKMSDGREVQFAGKRKVNKEALFDAAKIEATDGVVQLQDGAISVRMDFRNGDTRVLPLPVSLLARFAAHGGLQKFGDELAAEADKPLSIEDMVLAIDDLNREIQAGNWGKGRAEGGGAVAGASLILQAVLEVNNARRAASGKEPMTLQAVKDYIEKRLEAEKAKPEAERITRNALYKSFKNPATETGKVFARLEAEKEAKTSKVDANAELEAMDAS